MTDEVTRLKCNIEELNCRIKFYDELMNTLKTEILGEKMVHC